MQENSTYNHRNNEQLVTFHVGDLFMGINVMSVQEVITYQGATAIPLTSSEIEGLINLRGNIITVIDLRTYLELETTFEASEPKMLVLHNDIETIGVIVDEVGDVLEVLNDQYENTPGTFDALCKRLVKGVYKLDNSLLLEVKVESLIGQ